MAQLVPLFLPLKTIAFFVPIHALSTVDFVIIITLFLLDLCVVERLQSVER